MISMCMNSENGRYNRNCTRNRVYLVKQLFYTQLTSKIIHLWMETAARTKKQQ